MSVVSTARQWAMAGECGSRMAVCCCWSGIICLEKARMFNVVLVEPEIPPNTGNIGRLCLATASHLHLVKPLGYSLDDKALRRAGLDYWHEVNLTLWDSFEQLCTQHSGVRFWFITTKSRRSYWDATFEPGDFLVFGRETKGLPESLLEANSQRTLTIPMASESTRSLNLATAVGVVLYEAVRQVRKGRGRVARRIPRQ